MAVTLTVNFNLPKPDPEANVDEEFVRLQTTLDTIDAVMKTIADDAASRAAGTHAHDISEISGLSTALAGKMPASQTFKLDDLTDVAGADAAANGYILVKTSTGWLPSSPAAAIGEHEHGIADVVGLPDALVSKADAAAVATALSSRLPIYLAGSALPSSDIGPIWHATYAAVMTWQTFSANGAAYAGYASVDVGRPGFDGQPTSRPGFLKRNGASLSKTTYAALWHWALHNGRVVALGSWAAGAYVFADNGDGTFKIPDNRAEFTRAWDDARGIDAGRTFGSSQLDAFQGHKQRFAAAESGLNASGGGTMVFRATGTTDTSGPVTDGTNGTPRTAAETRPRNVALLGDIKF